MLLGRTAWLFLSSGAVFATQINIPPFDQNQAVPTATVQMVENPNYRKHCGACHFPYQPGLLPARSWGKVLGKLSDHFGESAELPDAELQVVRGYLLDNAADVVRSPLGDRILRSLVPNHDLPLRITETPFFKSAHHILEMVLTEEFKSEVPYSNCVACHPAAEEGDYNEDDTKMPGMVDWKRWHMEFQ